MRTLLEALERKRAEENLSVRALAKKLQVSNSILVLIGQGKRRPGIRVLQAILAAYPDLSLIVHEYISNGGNDGHGDSGNSETSTQYAA